MERSDLKKLVSIPVIVAALGYFVDIYDLLLFGIVRLESLKAIGIAEDMLVSEGEYLIQVQMIGLLVGGIIWGIMGDKRGRLSVLFGSILLYSLANLANGFVTNISQYAILRFIAGIGLAGELGAGITLVSEILPTRLRGYGTTLVATVGLFGAVAGNIVARETDWQVAYWIGGSLGLVLLIMRIGVFESGLFVQLKREAVSRGNMLMLFTQKERFTKYLGCILIGLPIWYTIGVLITFSPEIAAILGYPEKVEPGDAIMWSYIGLAFGDMSSGLISQYLKSRKKVVLIFILMTAFFILLYLLAPFQSMTVFFTLCFALGFSIGYWALFVTIAAEQFGTNLRSTVTTTVPNFIRGTMVPIILLFQLFRGVLGDYLPEDQAYLYGALLVGLITIVIALLSLQMIQETFSKDLDYVEEDIS